MTLVQATIALAIVAWAAAEWLKRRGPRGGHSAARAVWTAGALLLGLHTLAAFHVVHGWSHQAAADETARQTAALTGLSWSGGLFVNYAFLAVWAADAGWWWAAPASYRAPAIRDSDRGVRLLRFHVRQRRDRVCGRRHACVGRGSRDGGAVVVVPFET